MDDLAQLILLLLLYLPFTVLLNRLQLVVSPAKKDKPGQGTIFISALLSLILFLVVGAICLGDSPGGEFLWTVYLAVLLSCGLLVYVSIMCVSESGRRFYLMDLIDRSHGITLEELKSAYGRDHMLSIRLQRLCTWNVLSDRGSVYRLQKFSAYAYSRFFQLWGRLLGFKWS